MTNPQHLTFSLVDGRLVPLASRSLSPSDRGFTLADGLFETMVGYAGRVFRIEDHIARLTKGANVLHIPIPSEAELIGAIKSGLNLSAGAYSIVRLTVSRGNDYGRGLDIPQIVQPSIVVRITPGSLSELVPGFGRTVVVSSIRRNHFSPLSKIKSLSYTEAVISRLEARNVGADDALTQNIIGLITGATSSNIFAVLQNHLVTPPEDDGVLLGIGRKVILEEAERLNILASEASLSIQNVEDANEVFLTNVVTGVAPVTCVSGKIIGNGSPGYITNILAKAYDERVKRELRMDY